MLDLVIEGEDVVVQHQGGGDDYGGNRGFRQWVQSASWHPLTHEVSHGQEQRSAILKVLDNFRLYIRATHDCFRYAEDTEKKRVVRTQSGLGREWLQEK